MGVPDPREFDELLTTILTFGDAGGDGGGIGVRPSGKVIKIPPRQDLQAIPSDRRDEMIVQAVQILAQGLDNAGMRAALERATGEAEQLAR